MRQFEKLTATHLYCNNCDQSMPVREHLLLVLPDGNMYDYKCMRCGESVGSRKATKGLLDTSTAPNPRPSFRAGKQAPLSINPEHTPG